MTQRTVGVLELASKYRYGLTAHGVPLYLFRPYDEALPEFIVGSKSRDTSHNQIALVDVPATSEPLPPPPAKLRGALVRLIGPIGDPAAEREGLLLHYCAARQKTSEPPPPSSLEDVDRTIELSATTGWITFHVDPPGCRDIDDAIAYHPATESWAITIADAAAAVPAGSAIDVTARAIGSTFYDLEGRAVIPMLPPAISEDSASLLPGQRRRGLSLIMEPDKPDRFATSWITVAHSFTYDNFLGSPVAAQLRIYTETDAHVCVEKWMVHYNRAAATLLANHLQGVLRVQSAAGAAKVATWPASLAHLAKEAAVYAPATDTTGHSSLGMEYYTHASSPLRRYADLINQRCLKAILHPATAAATTVVAADDIATLNARSKANKRWTRDLTFLTHVTPGHVHEIDIVWVDPAARRVWVPQWGRLLRLRHEPLEAEPGTAGRIQIFCDPTRRNWKQRILTAPCGPAIGSTPTDHPAPAATATPL
jgi:exoribonuclease R